MSRMRVSPPHGSSRGSIARRERAVRRRRFVTTTVRAYRSGAYRSGARPVVLLEPCRAGLLASGEANGQCVHRIIFGLEFTAATHTTRLRLKQLKASWFLSVVDARKRNEACAVSGVRSPPRLDSAYRCIRGYPAYASLMMTIGDVSPPTPL